MAWFCFTVGLLLSLVCLVGGVEFSGFFSRKGSAKLKWDEERIADNIEIRLVKRTWSPATPVEPERVLDKAPYSVDEAFNLLKNGPMYEFESRPLKEADSLFLSSGYDPSKESIVVIHTLTQDADENFVKTTITALSLRNFQLQYNLFAVHMPELHNFMVTTAKRVLLGFHNQYSTMAHLISGFLMKGITMAKLKPSQINMIGFCFSSQLAGYIARALPDKTKSILSLDPYGVGLWRVSMKHLSRLDATFVHAFHTNSFYEGTTHRVATADFVFNNGNIQPGCWFKDIDCSHHRSVPYLWYSILFSDLFIARRCSYLLFFRLCLCESKPTVHITYPPNPEATGTYYISTSVHRPYGLVENGATCWPKKNPQTGQNSKKPGGNAEEEYS